jgi:uncharacterized protein (DUF427 family)
MPHSPQPDQPRVRLEPCPRRIRVFFGAEAVADTTRAVYLYETGHLPVYYIPLADLRMDLLRETGHHTTCPYKGEASYYSVVIGDRTVENAAWFYPKPIDAVPELADYAAFYWDKADAWFEEDDEVFVHPRDPHHRVDVLNSSRHVQVLLGGTVVADSHRPRLLFETGLPTRYYLPKLDVRRDLLVPSPTRTRCPYKGEAVHWSIEADGEQLDDGAWAYPAPLPEIPKIENLIAFYNEKVDLIVDGIPQERPRTKWS